MKNFKRILASVLAVMFVVTGMVMGISARTSDVWYQDAVDYLDGLTISGIGATGSEPATREEFVTWISKIESHQLVESAWNNHKYETIATSVFNDVDDSAYKGAIGYAVNREFIQGYGDDTFAPKATIKLAEAAAVIVRLMGYQSRVNGDDWAYNNMQVANSYCHAFDATFLSETGTYDPNYELTKGEAAYLLYTVMNGAISEAVYADDVVDATEQEQLIWTNQGVDLGAWFEKSGKALAKATFVVTKTPYFYAKTNFALTGLEDNTAFSLRRLDAYLAGATYASLYQDTYLHSTRGNLNPTGDVELVNVKTGYTLTVPATVFATLVQTAAGANASENPLNFAERGTAVTVFASKDNRAVLCDTGDFTTATGTEVVDFKINATVASDSYIAATAQAVAATGTWTSNSYYVGWNAQSLAAASNAAYARMSTTLVGWKDVKKTGSTVTAGTIVIGDAEYKVGGDGLKVYTTSDIANGFTTEKTVVSVVGYAGDKVYAGAKFDDNQKAILLASDTAADYGQYFDTTDVNTVATTFVLTKDVPNFVAYELKVKGGAFVSSYKLALQSEFVQDGYFDKDYVDLTKPLTVDQAYQLILSPAQGECNVVFTDTNGDGKYDIAVVTESTRALYFEGVNEHSTDIGGAGYIGGQGDSTHVVYDSFGNYITAVQGTKGNSMGGLVVDKVVATGGTSGTGTDAWNVYNAAASNKVQLVVIGSEERYYSGPDDTMQYGVKTQFPYKVVDVATLTTAYIEKVNTKTTTVGGKTCYALTVVNTSGEASVIYVPTANAVSEQITLDITLDGITSSVVFNSGKELLSFVTDHATGTEVGTVVSGAWMAGHTVKYVVDANNVAWCMVDTVVKDAVKGYVIGATQAEGTTDTGIYKVSVVSSAVNKEFDSNVYTTIDDTATAADLGAFAKTFLGSLRTYGGIANTATVFSAYGSSALVTNPTITVMRITDSFNKYFGTTTTYNNGVFKGISGNCGLTGVRYSVDGTNYGANILSAALGGVDVVDWTYTSLGNGGAQQSEFFKESTYISYADYMTYVDPAYMGFVDVTTDVATLQATAWNEATLGILYTDTDVTTKVDYLADTYDNTATYYTVFFDPQNVSFDLFFAPVVAEGTVGTTANVPYAKLFSLTAGISYVDTDGDSTKDTYRYLTGVNKFEVGSAVKELEVKASATAVWDYSPATYTLVNNILVNKKYIKGATVGAEVNSGNLCYISFAKDAGSYYTIQGLAATSTTEEVLDNNIRMDNTGFITPSAGNYRTRAAYFQFATTYTTHSASEAWLANANQYVLSYELASPTKTDVIDPATSAVIGYSQAYNMVVGSEPYYRVKAAATTGASPTIELVLGTVDVYNNVTGSFYYQAKASALIPLLTETDKTNVVDDGTYAAAGGYYVDPVTKYVYVIHGTLTYDTTKLVSDKPQYDTTGATLVNNYSNKTSADLKAGTTPVLANGFTAKDLASFSFEAYVDGEAGYVPGLTHVTYVDDMAATATQVNMRDTTKIVVATPVNGVNYKFTVTTIKELVKNKQTIMASYIEYQGTEALWTFLNVIGEIVSTETPTTPSDPGTEPTEPSVNKKLPDTTAGTVKLVYLPTDADIVVESVETGKYWVIRSTKSAIDVTTGAEIGALQVKFETYEKAQSAISTGIALTGSGYYVVNSSNAVIAKVNVTTAGTYGTTGTSAANITVGKAGLTSITSAGEVTLKIGTDTVVPTNAVKFVYTNWDGTSVGIGGDSRSVAVKTTAEIEATWANEQAIVSTGVGSVYDQATVDAAKAAIATKQAAVVDNYYNGTFWGVASSPVLTWMTNQQISYQSTATLNFNYVVIGGTMYVFVNTFNY